MEDYSLKTSGSLVIASPAGAWRSHFFGHEYNEIAAVALLPRNDFSGSMDL